MASELFRISSLLLAAIFAFSASAQLNDPDWYLWLPLYSFACLVIPAEPTTLSKSKQMMRKMAFSVGLLLFIKVVAEDYWRSDSNNIAGFLSLDMRERVVREKLGSWLVVSSMFLHQTAAAASVSNQRVLDYGMGILVGIAYGLSITFFALHRSEMNF